MPFSFLNNGTVVFKHVLGYCDYRMIIPYRFFLQPLVQGVAVKYIFAQFIVNRIEQGCRRRTGEACRKTTIKKM